MQKIADVLLACETAEQIHKDSKIRSDMEEKFLTEFNKDPSSTTQSKADGADKDVEKHCDISTSGDDFDFDL